MDSFQPNAMSNDLTKIEPRLFLEKKIIYHDLRSSFSILCIESFLLYLSSLLDSNREKFFRGIDGVAAHAMTNFISC